MSGNGAVTANWRGQKITYYGCDDCALRYRIPLGDDATMRPNNKFCDRKCMAFVLDMRAHPNLRRRPKGWQEFCNQVEGERK